VATADTGKLIAAAVTALGIIFKPGYRYKKAGVTFLELAPAGRVQSGLFDQPTTRARSGACVRSISSMRASAVHDRLRHSRRTPGLEPSAGIHFAALHDGLERVAARLKRHRRASKRPVRAPMPFRSAHRGPSIARLVQTASVLDRRASGLGTSINFWNRISMTDSNFALDAGQSRAADSAWRMSPKATLPRCILFSNA
jgi:hypothetical protein